MLTAAIPYIWAMRVWVCTAVGVSTALLAVSGCAGTSMLLSRSSDQAAGPTSVAGGGAPGGAGGHGGCPVTRPAGPRPPRRALLNFGDPIATASDPGWYGNGVLWTQLPLFAGQSIASGGGGVHLKVPWFRGHTGIVTIGGAPLSGPPARFSAHVGTPAEYGRYGFAPSILQFGRPGCWRLHAHLASQVLTLVVRVAPAA